MKKFLHFVFRFLKPTFDFICSLLYSDWKKKLFFLFSTLLFSFALWLLTVSLTGGWLKKMKFSQNQSLEKRADHVYKYEPKRLMKFNDLFKSKKYSILVDKIVVNLKTDRPQFRNPMGLFQFYLKIDSKKGALEITKLQKILLDRVQREIEEFTYDEAVSLEGKRELKSVIQDSVNDILTQGRVEEVYFEKFIVKP